MRASLLVVCGLALGGCAWEPGQGFAVVEPTVRASYEPVFGREAGDGYQRLSSDYQLRVDEAALRLSGIELMSAGSGGGSFDPANPPAGYSLCHGGHCHRSDGALIPYEQVAAEVGGGTGASAVVTLTTGEPWNLLTPETRAVGCEPGCALPQTQVSQGRWNVQSLHLTGWVRDARTPARFTGERRFEVDLPARAGNEPLTVLSGALDLPSDRKTPPQAKLDLDLVLTAALFDAVDFGALEYEQGVLRLSDTARTALVERLAKVSPRAEVSRGTP
ncbi:hypothetical protein [Melittangium boletus]|uniref:Lipoprotein n=1 Tax=Melittangium boletus DSM 14713 TaxID=1294270 RepID=A0A286NUX8_9BACT|nr:hypothetical protein [Melittangium boletus]ATB26829.1 lipoprotein [Melittangium boletus DSM 14713]